MSFQCTPQPSHIRDTSFQCDLAEATTACHGLVIHKTDFRCEEIKITIEVKHVLHE